MTSIDTFLDFITITVVKCQRSSPVTNHPETIAHGVIGNAAHRHVGYVDGAYQRLVTEVQLIDGRTDSNTIEVRAVVRHVAAIATIRDIKFLDEVAIQVVLIEHRRTVWCPTGCIDVISVGSYAILHAAGAVETQCHLGRYASSCTT